MTTRLAGRVVRRPSLPLTERDEVNLALLREIPIYRQALADLTSESADGPAATAGTGSITEAALLHAIFQAGVGAVRAAAEEAGYAVSRRSGGAGSSTRPVPPSASGLGRRGVSDLWPLVRGRVYTARLAHLDPDPFTGRAVCDDIVEVYQDEVRRDLGALTPKTMAEVSRGLKAALAS
jgi:hypothetical protein